MRVVRFQDALVTHAASAKASGSEVCPWQEFKNQKMKTMKLKCRV